MRPPALPMLVLLVALCVTAGCTKRQLLTAGEAAIDDGRVMEVGFTDGSVLRGRIVRGSTVRYTHSDSLFLAVVADVNGEFVELSGLELLTALDEWTELRRNAERSETAEERQESGSALLLRDEISSVRLVTVDTRRILTESLFWIAAAVALGYAAGGD